MSVIRPRPPTDPISHRPPRAWKEDGEAAERFRDRVARIDRARSEGMAIANPATAILEAYGTLRSHARRRESPLFTLLDLARRVRDSVDRVVAVGDEPDRAVVDLLLATCCHPFHDLLPRHERGGRPRVVTLGPRDDDDRVQGVLDLLAGRSGDRLADAWAPVAVGPVATPRARAMLRLLHGIDRGADAVTASGALATAADAVTAPGGNGIGFAVVLPGAGDGGDACLGALLPAAIAGIDVVRFLEGMAAMERRFGEAPPEANPVVTFVAVPRAAFGDDAESGAVGRRLLVPPHWPGLVDWEASLSGDTGRSAIGTAVVVEESRRRPFGAGVEGVPLPGVPALDAIHLPRADEHTLGQLLSLLRLASVLGERVG